MRREKAAAEDQFAPCLRAILEVGDGPVNCQLAAHDTPVERAVELTAALMDEALAARQPGR